MDILSKKKFLFKIKTSKFYIRFDEELPKGWLLIIDILLGLAILLAIAAFLLIPYIIHMVWKIEYNSLGTYGDFFGSFTSLFTVLAFGGLIISLLLQRRDLELQRKELEESRKELKAQATAQEKQAIHMEQQFNIMKEQFELSKTQVKLVGDQSNLMKSQTESMTKQIEMEMRPYLNAYIDYKPGSHALIIKNIGRSACTEFNMKPSFKGNIPEESKKYTTSLIKHLSDYHLDIIPAGMEYAVELDNMDVGLNLSELYEKNICLEIDYHFKGLEKKPKHFIIQYNLDYGKTPTKRSQYGFRDLCDKLDDLGKDLKENLSQKK